MSIILFTYVNLSASNFFPFIFQISFPIWKLWLSKFLTVSESNRVFNLQGGGRNCVWLHSRFPLFVSLTVKWILKIQSCSLLWDPRRLMLSTSSSEVAARAFHRFEAFWTYVSDILSRRCFRRNTRRWSVVYSKLLLALRGFTSALSLRLFFQEMGLFFSCFRF